MKIQTKVISSVYFILCLFNFLNTQAQTENENLMKYWNYRNKFKSQFVSIGPLKGMGINISNIDADPTSLGQECGSPAWTLHSPNYGFRRMGDAMAQQGDYLAVLATEYKLLNDENKDCSGTLNELYYAINAVDRLDKTAEAYFNPSLLDDANGFLLRDDFDETLIQNWTDEYPVTNDPRDRFDAMYSSYYSQKNVTENGGQAREGNACSQDQMIALMLGFVHIKKFVGHVYVKPKPTDTGFFIDDKIKEITEHFMQYLTTIYQWNSLEYRVLKTNITPSIPSVTSPAIGTAGSLTVFQGLPANTLTVTSNCDVIENWVLVNPVLGKKEPSGSEARPFSYGIAKAADVITGNVHNYAGTIGIIHKADDNIGDGKPCVIPHDITVPLSIVNTAFWQNFQNLTLLPGGIVPVNIPKMCVILPPFAAVPLLPTIPYTICFDAFTYKFQSGLLDADYNVNLALSLAVAGDSWSHYNIDRMSNDWDMWIFDLSYAVLHNVPPLRSQAFYLNILNSAPCDGPHNYSPASTIDPTLITGEWDENSRWSHPFGPSGFTRGEYNGNDYMWMYNLYQLAFKSLPTTPAYTNSSCSCTSNYFIDNPQNSTNENIHSTHVNLKRKFPEYLDVNIPIEEYLTHNLLVDNIGKLTVQTDLNVCNNSTLAIELNGLEIGNSSNTSISERGLLRVKSGSTLKLSSGASVIINDYSKIIIEAGANLIIEPYVTIKLQGEHSLFDVQGYCNIDIPSFTSVSVRKGSASNGGVFKLNAGTFDLNSDAYLEIEHCKVYLNNYTFNYFENAHILLTGEESTLQFGGIINLQPKADLHFSGDGYLGFKLNWINNGDINIHGDASNSITLQGNGKIDKIAEVAMQTYVKADDNLKMQNIKDGLFEFGRDASWLMASSYRLDNLEATSIAGQSGGGDGFWVCAAPNHHIENVTFKALKNGLRASLFWGTANTLRMYNCSFEQCLNAFKYEDKGVMLENIDFIDCHYPIIGVSASTPSYFTNIAIKEAGGTYDDAINISSAGTATTYLNNCNIMKSNNGYYSTGIRYQGTSLLNLKCSNITANNNSLFLYNNVTLNVSPIINSPSSYRFGGNNSFRTDGGGISCVSANQLILENGFNDFTVDNPVSAQGSVMSGVVDKFSIDAQTGQKFIPAHNNKWVNEPIPSTKPNLPSNLTLISLLGNPTTGRINIIDDSPNYIACADEPGSVQIGYNERGLPINYCPKCPPIKSDYFWNTPMNDALRTALSTSIDESNSDNIFTSFKMFSDIFNTSTTYEESRINWDSEFAYLKMKELFGLMIKDDRIGTLDVKNEYCTKILEAESKLIINSREKDDDMNEFYYSIDLATTYRLLGNNEAALNVLNNIAPCLRLKEEQIKFLQNWITQIETEQLFKTGNIGIFEFDNYAGIQPTGNREFRTIGNTQANIDTIIYLSQEPLVPSNLQFVTDNAGNKYSISTVLDTVSYNYHLMKGDLINSVVWEQDFNGRNNGTDSVKAILIDDNNFIYVTGKSWNGVDFDVMTIKYDTAGNSYWKAVYNDMLIGNDEPIGFEIDSLFHMKVFVRSYNDSIQQYKTIYYSQCDTNCAQNYRIKNARETNTSSKLNTDLALNVFPTPTSDKLNLVVTTNNPSEIFSMKLYDVSGKLVLERKINYKYVMDVREYTKGVYQLIVSDGKHFLKKRVVIN
ncbi:MAG: T9SS type A sorting domain-containing protein [Bacteroidetes bacterium]|nr:T9SS type A sorting domain-containing protein [Bacteroidota bacterium]